MCCHNLSYVSNNLHVNYEDFKTKLIIFCVFFISHKFHADFQFEQEVETILTSTLKSESIKREQNLKYLLKH